ncbi:unnamed protein product [Rhizoctonia solani]|uniref:Uncharacterized protein n=1 Tax=Rhizoctonia solani TaxID=456999 RepID=A0A8H2WGB8_9AGAM|nr:unnamed protein product [Rhizoctonia solani]
MLQDILEAQNESNKAAMEEAAQLEKEHHKETCDMLQLLNGELHELMSLLKDNLGKCKEDEAAQCAENNALHSIVKLLIDK